MSQALHQRELYQELVNLPESLTGEILNDQLYAHPRPGGKHVLASYNIGMEVGGPFYRGIGGPGGWWILQEPEIHLILDREVAVPDVAGWRKERLPEIPESHKFTVVPDWICEVLSPSTASIDREIKMPLYAQHGVKYLWLVDPKNQTLEAYKLVDSSWTLLGEFSETATFSLEPFDAVSFTLEQFLK